MKLMSRSFAVGLALVTLAGVGVAMSPASGSDFDLGTVAKKYNFSFTGHGGDGSCYAAVGWLQFSDAGGATVTGGNIVITRSFAGSTSTVTDRLDLGTTNPPHLTVLDPANGIYGLFAGFEAGGRSSSLSAVFILSDARGHAGKVTGNVSYSALGAGGVGVGGGEIIAP